MTYQRFPDDMYYTIVIKNPGMLTREPKYWAKDFSEPLKALDLNIMYDRLRMAALSEKWRFAFALHLANEYRKNQALKKKLESLKK